MTPEPLRELIQRGESLDVEFKGGPSTYRRLGVPSAYVRRRGFEPIQQEQMILQYVRAHGRITRREAAELCQISPFQATRLLQKLVKQEKLTAPGTGKGTWYEQRS